jgi:hypothetical protein
MANYYGNMCHPLFIHTENSIIKMQDFAAAQTQQALNE